MAAVARLKLIQSALTDSATGTSYSLGGRANSFAAWLNVSACHASTTVNAKLQHSPDGTNWIDLVSFTAIAGTTGTEAKYQASFTGAGVVFPNVRAVVTLAGATKSATVLVALYFDDNK